VEVYDFSAVGSSYQLQYIFVWRRNGTTMREYISYSWTSRKPMIQLGGKYSDKVWSTHENNKPD
jgi:hypothetical protein